jgi:hypothetical protein
VIGFLSEEEAHMSAAVKKSDREHVLSELEKYYSGKLASVQAKRGYSTLDGPREIVLGGAINLKLDARERRLVVTWDK